MNETVLLSPVPVVKIRELDSVPGQTRKQRATRRIYTLKSPSQQVWVGTWTWDTNLIQACPVPGFSSSIARYSQGFYYHTRLLISLRFPSAKHLCIESLHFTYWFHSKACFCVHVYKYRVALDKPLLVTFIRGQSPLVYSGAHMCISTKLHK